MSLRGGVLGVLAAVAACGGSVSIFGTQGGGGQGAVTSGVVGSTTTGGPSTVNGTSIAVTVGTTGVGGASPVTSAGGAMMASASMATIASSTVTTVASSSSGGGMCMHDPCATGAALAPMCDACVTKLCAADAYCCKTNWDFICVGEVWKQCMLDCKPNGPSCDKQYNTAPGYQLCWQGSDCGMAYNSTQKTCAAICAEGGGECTAAYNDANDQKCQVGQKVLCTTNNLASAVCVCSRGCGGGAPCTAPQKCTNGKCA